MADIANMQAMHYISSFIIISFLVIAGLNITKNNNSDYKIVSEAMAADLNIQTINLTEIKNFVKSGEHRVLFIYASWCPYCKKQMRGFSLLKDEYPTDDIIAISTDQDQPAFRKYIESYTNFPFTPYIYLDKDLDGYLKNVGATFGGGIPYFVVFKDGKFYEEFSGLTHPKKLVNSTEK